MKARAGELAAAGDERVAVAAFVGGAVLAGGNAVAIRFSNRELDPLWGAGLRFSLAALLLFGATAVLGLSLPRGRALTGALLYGALSFGVGFALAYTALVELHAGFGQTLLALVPLLALMLAALHGQERLGWTALAGALVAVLGVAVMTGASLGGDVPAWSVAAALGGATALAWSAVVVRAFPTVHPVTMNAVAMGAGAVLLLLGSLAAGEDRTVPERSETVAAIAYLVAIGSVVVFVLYLVVLARWSASRASYEFVLIPIVTVVLSAWLDDEPIGVGLVVGGLLVLSAVYVGALRPVRGARGADEPSE